MKPLQRYIAAATLVAQVAGCTHLPSGQKAFDNFEQCITANLGLAAVGGIAVGALGKSLLRRMTVCTELRRVAFDFPGGDQPFVEIPYRHRRKFTRDEVLTNCGCTVHDCHANLNADSTP